MRISNIKETCLYVQDLEKTREFYADLFGLKVISMVEGSHVFLKAGDSMLLCFLPEKSRVKVNPPPHYAYGKQHFAFEVPDEDYYKWKKYLPEKGVTIEDVQFWGNGQRESFYFRDPDGHSVEILQPGIWG